MSAMLSLFDYIYYRIYKFFEEKGDNVPETKGSLILSLIQFFTLLDILVFVRMIYEFPLPKKVFILPVIISLAVINWYRYERNFEIKTFQDQWRNESLEKKRRNGWLIGLYLLLSFLVPALHGYLKHNLNAI